MRPAPLINFFAVCLLATAASAAAPQKSASSSRSPHGPLAISCQNCHTVQGWKPIRAVPEFDHSKTRYPLRGMHEKVACMQCHTKLVFSNVGNKCADCHADIHRGKLSAACETCHTVKGWKVAIQQIQNHNNRFPLTGAHAMAACEDCHKNGALSNFTTMSTACISCHEADYQRASAPAHAALKFPTDCTACHTMNTWSGAQFDHLKFTGFALTGAHATLDCTACHLGGKYQGTPATCIGCHLPDFQKTKNPNHVQLSFPQTCQTCHTTAAWSPATFDHNLVGFPLTGAHTSTPCAQCHVNGNYNLTSTTCVSCHLKDFQGTTNPNHVQNGFPQTCQSCHSTTAWQPATFDHATTGFKLTGAHISTPCLQCHVNNNYNLTNTACVSCHLTNFQNSTNPNHAKLNLPQTCETCHVTSAWQPASFDHGLVGFQLTGAHATLQCAQCHTNNNYGLTSSACVSCHRPDFDGARNPNHVQQGFPDTCATCHSTTAWQPATFNHAATGFTLTGAHASLTCTQCHGNNNYNLTSAACASCHQKDYDGATDPPHAAAGFPTTCETCHSTVNWQGATFDHSKTGFALTGGHIPLTCAQCHVNGNYKITTAACVSCHLKDFQGTTNPNHVQGGFPQTCESCHSTTNWSGASFDHSKTGFPLTGTHTTVACSACHVNNNYNLTSAACVSCHLKDYQGTADPKHAAAGFPTTCESCHSTTNWLGATFNHSTTGFTLTGAHTTLACAQCHVNGNYSLNSTACVNCHLKDFQGTTDPNHVAAGFPQTCDSCHTTVNWQGATFNHATTGFALTGAHTSLTCAQCHVSGNYSLTSGACVNCHLKDFQGTTDPNHAAAGFPQTCDSCHTTVNWQGATFNHTTTGFALTGAHTSLTCAQCHINGNYSLTSGACVNCHLKDFQGTTNPNHVTLGYPQTCDSCHSTTNWLGATFDHNKTPFPLTGAHVTVTCTSCHVNGQYAGTPTDCYACHKTVYLATTDPNHKAAAFPTTCVTCHNTSSWQGATFNHTWFPIYSGAHVQGVWTTCADCHTNSNDYSVFSCITCHTHAKTVTDQHHQGVRNYVYNSANCYACHTNGRAG